MSAKVAPLTGRCMCGAVAFEISEPLPGALYCHCKRCQRRTGSAFSVTGLTQPGSFAISEGADVVRTYPGGRWLAQGLLLGVRQPAFHQPPREPGAARGASGSARPGSRHPSWGAPVRGLRSALAAASRRRAPPVPGTDAVGREHASGDVSTDQADMRTDQDSWPRSSAVFMRRGARRLPSVLNPSGVRTALRAGPRCR